MSRPSSFCINAPIYTPDLFTNNTGACMSLNTPQTLPLMTSCCPPNSIYNHNTTTAVNSTFIETCSYVVCDITGYTTWAATASCLGRSVIVEGEAHQSQQEGDGTNPDSVRGCAFHPGSADEDAMVSLGTKSRVGTLEWGLLICAVLGVLGVAG